MYGMIYQATRYTRLSAHGHFTNTTKVTKMNYQAGRSSGGHRKLAEMVRTWRGMTASPCGSWYMHTKSQKWLLYLSSRCHHCI